MQVATYDTFTRVPVAVLANLTLPCLSSLVTIVAVIVWTAEAVGSVHAALKVERSSGAVSDVNAFWLR